MILVQIQDANCIELYCLKTHLKAQSSVKKTNLKVYRPLAPIIMNCDSQSVVYKLTYQICTKRTKHKN